MIKEKTYIIVSLPKCPTPKHMEQVAANNFMQTVNVHLLYVLQVLCSIQVLHTFRLDLKSIIRTKVLIVIIVWQFVIRFNSNSNCCLHHNHPILSAPAK